MHLQASLSHLLQNCRDASGHKPLARTSLAACFCEMLVGTLNKTQCYSLTLILNGVGLQHGGRRIDADGLRKVCGTVPTGCEPNVVAEGRIAPSSHRKHFAQHAGGHMNSWGLRGILPGDLACPQGFRTLVPIYGSDLPVPFNRNIWGTQVIAPPPDTRSGVRQGKLGWEEF